MHTLVKLTAATSVFLHLLACEGGDIGPSIVSDAIGPDLEVTSPPRASYLGDVDSITVTGAASDNISGTVDMYLSRWGGLSLGNSSNVPSDYPYVQGTTNGYGSFSLSVPARHGMNLLQTWAEDGVGLQTTDTRAALVGGLLPDGAMVPNGFMIRIDDSSDGLGALEDIVSRELQAFDVASYVPSPFYSACDPLICTVFLDAFVGDFSFGGPTVDVDPKASGEIEITAALDNLTIPWTSNARASDMVFFQEDGTISAGSLALIVRFTPQITTGGQVLVSNLDIDIEASAFDIEITNALFEVVQDLGVDFDGMVFDAVTDAVRQLGPQVAQTVADQLSTLPTSRAFELPAFDDGHLLSLPSLSLSAMPTSLQVDDDAIIIRLATGVSTLSSDLGGSLYRESFMPSGADGWESQQGLGVALNLNAVNQVLHVARTAGMFDMTVPASSFDIDPSMLGYAFPGISNPTVTIESNLDPVMVPCSRNPSSQEYCPPRRIAFDGTNLDAVLQMGDLHVTLRDGDGSVRCEAWMTVSTDVGLNFQGDLIVPTVGENQIWTDIIEPAELDQTIEAILERFVIGEVSQATRAVNLIKVPSFAGLAPVFYTSGVHEGSDFYGVSGTLEMVDPNATITGW